MRLGRPAKILLALVVAVATGMVAYFTYRAEKESRWSECSFDVPGLSGRVSYMQRHVPDEVDMVYERKLRSASGEAVALPASPCTCGVGLANYYVSPDEAPSCIRVKDGLFEYFVDMKGNRVSVIEYPRKGDADREIANFEKYNWTYIGRVEGQGETPVFVPVSKSKEEVF